MNRLIIEKLSSPSKSSLKIHTLMASFAPLTSQPLKSGEESSVAKDVPVDPNVVELSFATAAVSVLLEKKTNEQLRILKEALKQLDLEIAETTNEINSSYKADPVVIAKLMKEMTNNFIKFGLISENPTANELDNLNELIQGELMKQENSMYLSQEVVECMEQNITAGMAIFASEKAM